MPPTTPAAPSTTLKIDPKNAVALVINNREGMHQIQLPGAGGKGGVVLGPVITLLPGANFVPAADWEEAKKNPGVRRLLVDKIEPSRAPEQTPERVGKPFLIEFKALLPKETPLGALTDDEAAEVITELCDINLARRLLDEETRGRIQHLLKEQIARMTPAQRRAS